MECRRCENWVSSYGFCRLSTCKPPTTGNPKTCPYYERKKW